MFTLGGFFVLLLTNFLLYSQTSAKLSEMRNSGESNMALVKRIEAIQSEIREYQELRVAGSSSPEETYAFYLEEVAGNRPGGIWFNSLSVHPCTNKKEHGKALLLDYTVLILKGEARDPVSLNSLIGSLESLDWIRDIELVSYENSTEMKNASFELTILKR
jgi:Tfp pilus assembly protein PilN